LHSRESASQPISDNERFFKERPAISPEASATPRPTYQTTVSLIVVKITKVGVKELTFSNQENQLSADHAHPLQGAVSCRQEVRV
jgi:hypothetical protein